MKPRKTKQLVLIFLLFNVFCSCKDKDALGVNVFDSVERISNCDTLFVDKDILMGQISDIKVFRNTLVIKHMNGKYKFSFVSIDNGQLITKWGKKGEAPDEFVDFGSGFTIKDSTLVFLTTSKSEVNYVSLPDILKKKAKIRCSKEKYPYTVDFRPRRIKFLRDKKIVTGNFKQGLFGVLYKDDEIKTFSNFPFVCRKVKGIHRGSVYQTKIRTNNKLNKFVLSYLSSDIFEIYHFFNEKKIRRKYCTPFRYEPKLKKRGGRYTINSNESIAGLQKIAVSDSLICFMYSTMTYKEAKGESDEILCYDWDGNKKKKYILPFAINDFCINKNTIYGVKYYDDETIIYQFKM